MSYYSIKPNSRAACLSRIERARKVTQPLHCYGQDGEGRRAVRMLCPMDSKNDLLGGALRSVRTFEEVMRAAERRGEVRRVDHTGWYTDPDGCSSRDGSGLCWGVVAYLGHGRYLAGYVMGGTDCGGYRLDCFYDSELEAARAADGIAEQIAETERTYQQRWQEANRLHDANTDDFQELRKALALRNDPRPCFAGIREEAARLIEAIRRRREELAADYADIEI